MDVKNAIFTKSDRRQGRKMTKSNLKNTKSCITSICYIIFAQNLDHTGNEWSYTISGIKKREKIWIFFKNLLFMQIFTKNGHFSSLICENVITPILNAQFWPNLKWRSFGLKRNICWFLKIKQIKKSLLLVFCGFLIAFLVQNLISMHSVMSTGLPYSISHMLAVCGQRIITVWCHVYVSKVTRSRRIIQANERRIWLDNKLCFPCVSCFIIRLFSFVHLSPLSLGIDQKTLDYSL